MSDDKGTEPTQETTDDKPLGSAGEKALRERTDALRRAEAELAELRRFKAGVERDRLKDAIAAEKGLSVEMRDALAGDDREALEAHADKLKLVAKPVSMGLGRPREALKEVLTGGASNDADDDYELSKDQVSKAADRILGE